MQLLLENRNNDELFRSEKKMCCEGKILRTIAIKFAFLFDRVILVAKE